MMMWRTQRLGSFLALAVSLSMMMMTACTPSLSPTYVPAGVLSPSSAGGRGPHSLQVTDRINNSAPVVAQITELQRTGLIVIGAVTGGVIGAALASGPVTAKGTQFVCPSCAYTLREPPTTLVRELATAALTRAGISVAAQGDSELEIQVLRYEFVNMSGAFTVQVDAAIILRAILRQRQSTVVDVTLFETGHHDGGMALSASELEEFVGAITSRAVERLLSQPPLQAEL